MSSEMARAAVSSFGMKLFGMISGYLFIYLLSKRWGPEAVGSYSLSQTVLSILGMGILLGMNTSIVKYASVSLASSQGWAISAVHRKMALVILLLGAILCLLFYRVSGVMAHVIFHDRGLTVPLRLVACGLPFYALCTLNAETLRGLKRIKQYDFFLYTGVIACGILLLLLFTWLETTSVFSLFGYHVAIAGESVGIAALVFSYTIMAAVSMVSLYQAIPEKFAMAGQRAGIPLKTILQLSLPMLATSSIYLLNSQVDKVMIGMLKTTADVGIYNVALRISAMTSLGLAAVNSIAAPKIARLYSEKRMEELEQVLRNSARAMFWFSSPVFLVCLFFPGFLLKLFGPEFAAGGTTLVFLVIGQFVNTCCGSVGIFLNMTGHQIIFRNIVFLAMLINIGINAALVPRYGIEGAAVATTVSIVFWNSAAAWYCKRYLRLRTYYLPFSQP